MKIDKVVFACSEAYSGFWNTQARVYAAMGIQPVVLLHGQRSNTDMSEEHGQVIEVPVIPDLPWVLQLTWSKFRHPETEPDTTWMIGDIDMVPLSRAHFTTNIEQVPDTHLAHLNAGGISIPRLGVLDGFFTQGCQRRCLDAGHGVPGADLPGHYFVGKGGLFKDVFSQGMSLEEQLRHIVTSSRYGLGPITGHAAVPLKDRESNSYWYYWCAEENLASELTQAAMENGLIVTPRYYENSNDTQRINRDAWADGGGYSYSREKLVNRGFVDIHCARPYAKQAAFLDEIVKLSGVCE